MKNRHPKHHTSDLIFDNEDESKEEKELPASTSSERSVLSPTSTAVFSKRFGTTFNKDSKREEIENKALPFSDQTHIIVFYYPGSLDRAGIGHISLWDGERYFTYGPGECYQDAPDEMSALARAEADEKSYGSWESIIIPVDESFVRRRQGTRPEPGREDSLSKQMTQYWEKEDYRWRKRNCAHMVEDYLVRVGILNEKSSSLIVLRPGEIASKARTAGKEGIRKRIEQEKEFYKENKESFLLQRNYLLGLQAELVENKGLPFKKLGMMINSINVLNLMELEPDKIAETYFKIKTELAKKHYEGTSDRLLNHFYAKWLGLSFDLEKIPDMPVVLGTTLTVETPSRLRK